MGPGAGTAVLGGTGLGFANVLRPDASGAPGPRVGVVAAAGTGAQEVSALLDRWGVSVSQVVGRGRPRPVRAPCGGRMARLAVRALAADPGTDAVLLVSKPPSLQAAARRAGRVRQHARPSRSSSAWTAPGPPPRCSSRRPSRPGAAPRPSSPVDRPLPSTSAWAPGSRSRRRPARAPRAPGSGACSPAGRSASRRSWSSRATSARCTPTSRSGGRRPARAGRRARAARPRRRRSTPAAARTR